APAGDRALAGRRPDRRRGIHVHAADALAGGERADAAVVRLTDGRVAGVLPAAPGGVAALAAVAHVDVEVLAAARAGCERLHDQRLGRREAADVVAGRGKDQLETLAAGIQPGSAVDPAGVLVVPDDAVDELRVRRRAEVVRLGGLELRAEDQ